MLVSAGGERLGRRQVRARRAAGFGPGRLRQPRSRRRRSNERSPASRSPTRVPNGSPSNPAPSQSATRVERTAAAAAPAPAVPNSPRAAMPNVLAPAPLSSMRWNDAPTTTHLSSTPTDLQVAAANPPASPAAAGRGSAAARGRSDCARRRGGRGFGKADRIAAEAVLVMAAALALAGLTVSAIVRIGRMRARRAMRRKRRAMWDSAKTKRRSPQPMFHDEDAGLRRAGAVHNPRVPQDRTRAPQERTRAPQERPRARADARTPGADDARPQERPRPPQERRHCPKIACPRIVCPMIGSGSSR